MTTIPATAERGIDERGIDERAADTLFREARTAYAFDGTPVDDARLDRLYDLLRFAPTSMNTQPLRITYVRSDEAKARLLPHIAEGNRAKARSAPVVALLAADLDFHEHLPRLLPHAPSAKDYFADAHARAEVARFNATLQAGYFILAARAVGLDAGPLGGIDRAAIDAEFFAGTARRTILAVNLGRVAEGGTHPRSPRLEHHEATSVL